MNPSYLNHIRDQNQIRLIIMGKDPYPTNANGVPFCKPTWTEQLDSSYSGYHIFRSLGIESKSLETSFDNPIDYFIFLSFRGIIFLNLSYSYIGGPIRRARHNAQLREGFNINRPFLETASNIILCGEAKKNRWNGHNYSNSIEVVHPDIRNRNSRYQSIRENWLSNWSGNSIANRFDITI